MSKVVVLGDSSVGKSSVLMYFKNKFFTDKMESTIGCDFFARNVTLEDNTIKLLVWDTAGQEIFRSFTSNFLRGAIIIVIMYDITSLESFTNLKTWLDETEARPEAKVIICGNKSDLKSKINSLDYIYQLKTLYPKKDINYFGVVSAKTGYNVEELFKSVAKKIIDTNNYKNIQYNCNNTIKIDYGSKPPRDEDKCYC